MDFSVGIEKQRTPKAEVVFQSQTQHQSNARLTAYRAAAHHIQIEQQASIGKKILPKPGSDADGNVD